MRIARISFGCLAISIASCAYGNDSIARVGAGGITLLKNESIRMVQEVLEISPKKVRVHYRFLNEAKQNIEATVAFPMPPYGFNPGFSESMANVGPVESFNIWVAGRLVPVKKNRVALAGEVDVTEKLRKIGLSEVQIFETFGDCHGEDDGGTVKCGLSEAQESELAKFANYGWQVAETAYWNQEFPAGQEVEVIHEYPPFVGSRYDYSRIPGDAREACLDDGTRQAIVKRIDQFKSKGIDPVVSLSEVEYILGTGRNWKGSIKDFRLVIRKDVPGQIVSLCFPGKPKRPDASTIEFNHSEFAPQDKLVIYFYDVAKDVVAPPDDR